MKVEKPKTLEVGEHRGIIESVKITMRGGFNYCDIIIVTPDGKGTCSIPASLNKNTQLYALIEAVTGKELSVGDDIDVEEELEGIPVKFSIIAEKNPKTGKTYLVVLAETVRRATKEEE